MCWVSLVDLHNANTSHKLYISHIRNCLILYSNVSKAVVTDYRVLQKGLLSLVVCSIPVGKPLNLTIVLGLCPLAIPFNIHTPLWTSISEGV